MAPDRQAETPGGREPEPAPLLLPRGLFFEDFALGAAFSSAGRTVAEADILAFAGLSGDWNPLHVDESVAARTPFRGRIAHGLLVQAIASGLAMQMGIFHGTIAALLEMRIEYRSAVRPGDTIRTRLTVEELEGEPSPRRGWVLFRSEVENQEEQVVIGGTWKVLLNRRRDRDLTGAGAGAQTPRSTRRP
jgi:acyl dehydratase